MHICFPFQKKLHLAFFLFDLHFSASNSLQIFQLIPCKFLWDLTCLVSWGDKFFLCDELGFTDLLFLVQLNPFGTIEAYHSVPPISQQEKLFATYSVFLLIQLHSMNLVLYKHHIFIIALCCVSRTKPIRQIPESPSWKLMSKGERELTSNLNHIKGGERGITSKAPDAWCSRGEKSRVFKRGKTFSYLIICISSVSCLCSDFLFPIFSQYPMLDSGGARHLREGNSWIHCTSLPLGTCLIQCGTWYSLSTCHPSLGILVVSSRLL